MPTDLSLAEARAISLRAQCFGSAAPRRPIDLLDRLGAIQLDSVSVLARPQDLVPFSRLGPYDTAAMHRQIYEKKRGFEYWGHAASWLPMAEYRYFLWRMRAHREATRGWWKNFREEHAALYPEVMRRVREEGPLTTAAFEDPRGQRGTWWDWKPAKLVLEDLLDCGDLMCAGRTAGFARIYDLPERVLPPGLDTSDPGEHASHRHLLRRAVGALGVGVMPEIVDYYRHRHVRGYKERRAELARLLREMASAGELVEVSVEGWKGPAYATPEALAGSHRAPRHRPTFLSPFDNVMWERARVDRLFGFFYRIEIYVPGPKRVHGYYVLPLLARGGIRGRADLKIDRKAKRLLVPGLWLENGGEPDEAAEALRDLARHLGAETVVLDRAEPAPALEAIRARLP